MEPPVGVPSIVRNCRLREQVPEVAAAAVPPVPSLRGEVLTKKKAAAATIPIRKEAMTMFRNRLPRLSETLTFIRSG